MTKLKISLIIFLMALTLTQKGQDHTWTPSLIEKRSFKEFVTITQAMLKIRFFYKPEWVDGLKTGSYPESYTLNQVLDSLFRRTQLFYFTDRSGNIIVTKDFAVRRQNGLARDEDNFISPTAIEEVTTEQSTAGNKFILIGNPADINVPGKAVLSGYITNSVTHEPVAGVTVVNRQMATGTVSNELGFYSITLPKGIHTVHFSFIGMKEKSVNLDISGTGEMNVEMTGVLIPLKETVVSAEKNVVLQRFEVGMEKVNLANFKLAPALMGESDIVKSVLLVPGVKSVGEGSAGFNVRGGSADQNLILLYDSPVYSSSHFFGFFSAVNPDIINDVTLYKGGLPSRYGGRISSVLDISAKDGKMDEFRGSAGISPVMTRMMIEGPLRKDTLSYILAARTTYSNWIFNLIDYSSLQKSKASFYDMNGRLTWEINRKNKIDFSSYLSHDAFRLGADSLYRYSNNIQSVRWRHFFNSRFLSNLTLNNSLYKYSVSSEYSRPESFILSHRVNSTGLKADFYWFQGRNEVNFGSDLNYFNVLPGSYLPAGDSSLVSPHILRKERALESSFYIEDRFSVNSFLSINVGLRISSFITFGPADVMVYKPGFSKSSSTITDTLTFRNGEISSGYAGPEPRISMNFRTSSTTSLKINYNRTRQYIHLLSNSTSISPTDTWKLSDYNIKPQTGDQIAIGFYQKLFKNSVETSAEVYYKVIKNMADFKGGANLIMNENLIEEIVNVRGKAYGLELLIRKQEGKLRFSLGYTYSRTFIRSESKLKEEIINRGKWFPANFDKPNDFTVTFNYLFSRRLSFSADYTYNTGRPITYPVATYHMYEDILVHYSERNKYRIPDYSRLDLAIRISGGLRVRTITNNAWTFSVYNLLGRQNVYSVFFRKDGDQIRGYKLSVFGQAIPSVTFSFDF